MSRCEATVKQKRSENFGRQCERPAVTGGTLCSAHGGIEQVDMPIPDRLMRFRQRCRATKANGEPCKNYAIHGGSVCPMHGGKSGPVKKAARERLLEMVDPAMAQLLRIITKKDTSDADRIRAIQIVLDRTGYHAKAEVTAEIKPWMHLVSGEGSPAGILRSVPEDAEVIDAEVVEEPNPLDLPEVRDAADAIRREGGTLEPFEAEPVPEPGDAVVIDLKARSEPPKHLR